MKFIVVLIVALFGLALLPFVGQASNDKADNLNIETIAQVDAVTPTLQASTLAEITPSAGDEMIAPQPVVAETPQAASLEASALAIAPKEDAETESSEETQEEKIDYDTVLSFPITEDKMKAFVITADQIDKVNRKWDMLISGAESDTMAIEYIDLSNEEMANVLNNIDGLTVDQYNELFKYSTQNAGFRGIVNAFEQYYVVAPREEKYQELSAESPIN